MAANHAPTPWKREYLLGHIIAADGSRVGLHDLGIAETKHGNFASLANSRFVWRAINAHDELVAALQQARTELEAYELAATGETYNSLSLNAALAKAEAL